MKLLKGAIMFVAVFLMATTAFSMHKNGESLSDIFGGVTTAILATAPVVVAEKTEAEKENALIEKIKGQVNDLIKKHYGDNLPSELKGLKDALENTVKKDDLEKLKSELDKIGLEVKSLSENGKQVPTGHNLSQAFGEGYKKLMFNEDGSFKGKPKKGENLVTEVKAAATMTTSNILPSVVNAIPFSLGSVEPGITRVQRRKTFLLDIMNVAPTNKLYVQWAEIVNVDGAPDSTAQGAAKKQVDFDVQEASKKVEKVTDYIKVSTEMLDDVDGIQAEINNELMERLAIKVDDLLMSGDGSTPNIKGITEYAQAFDDSGFENSIENVNRFDVLRVAINQIEKNLFMANYIVLHPSDVAAMDLAKDDNGAYVLPPFIVAGGNSIKGVPVIANTGVEEGHFLVGDFTKANVRMRKDASISIGYENDDFTKNLITILAEIRLVHFVKANHANAFVYDDFATALTDIGT